MARRKLALTAVLLSLAATSAGCGGGHPSGSPAAPTVPTLSASPSAPTPTRAASSGGLSKPYLDSFERFWVAYARADAAGDENSAELAQYASGPALAQVRAYVRADSARGVAHKGSWQFRSLKTAGKTAISIQVSQCMDFSRWPVVATSDGATVESYPAWSDGATARMQSINGQWQVTQLNMRRAAC
jgi:hypothetical protein